MPSLPDQHILDGKYRLIKKLEEGGMGSVWFAEHLSLHSPVAVKLIGREVADTDEGLQRFLREARTAASLRSPHVVQILDYGVDRDTPYIVMELLDGESLAERLRRVGQLSSGETELVIRHITRAVARAHDAGIVHRDLKPANIFIIENEDEEIVKLLDFGIAKASIDALSSSIAHNTRTGAFLGTPFYVSPEQAEGIKGLDHRTDIWSMGVIAFECLLGVLPFTGDTFGSLVLSICTRPMPVPSKIGPVPPGFDGWFARACAREPEHRFQSAREAAAELRRLIQHAVPDDPPLTLEAGGVPELPVESRVELHIARVPNEAASASEAVPAEPSPRSELNITTAAASSSAITTRIHRNRRPQLAALGALGVLGLVVWLVALLRNNAPPTDQLVTTESAARPAAESPAPEPPPLAAPTQPTAAEPPPSPPAPTPPVPRPTEARSAKSAPTVAPVSTASKEVPVKSLRSATAHTRAARERPKPLPERVEAAPSPPASATKPTVKRSVNLGI
jgi:eukaryotic-like serine/threonine-protein kinase